MWPAACGPCPQKGHPAAVSRSRAVGGSRMQAAWKEGSGRAQRQDDHCVSPMQAMRSTSRSDVHDKTEKQPADLRRKPDAEQKEVDGVKQRVAALPHVMEALLTHRHLVHRGRALRSPSSPLSSRSLRPMYARPNHESW